MAKQTKRTQRATGSKPAPKANASKKVDRKIVRTAGSPEAPAGTKIVSMSSSGVLPTADQIRIRAYEIYERRSGHCGDANHDWMQAERELMRELTR